MRPNLNQIQSLGDFADTVHWYIQFPDIEKLGVGLNRNDINLRCESVNLPKREGSKVSVEIRGLPAVHQPGLYKPEGSLTVNLYDNVDNKMTKAIQKLVSGNYEQGTGKAKPKSEVETRIIIVRTDREHNPIYEYTFIGCFVESYEPGGDLQGSSADLLKPSITFSYDDFEERSLV